MIDIGVCECLCEKRVKHLDIGASGISCTIVAGKRCACGRYRYLSTFTLDENQSQALVEELQRCIEEYEDDLDARDAEDSAP